MHGVRHLTSLDGTPAAQRPAQQGLYQRIDGLDDLLRTARRFAMAEQHGRAQDDEPLPLLGQQGLLHLPLGAGIEGEGAGMGPQAGDDQQASAAVAAGKGGEGQHIVEVDPAKGLGGACLPAGGAEAAEGEIDGIGQLHGVQRVERDR